MTQTAGGSTSKTKLYRIATPSPSDGRDKAESEKNKFTPCTFDMDTRFHLMHPLSPPVILTCLAVCVCVCVCVF